MTATDYETGSQGSFLLEVVGIESVKKEPDASGKVYEQSSEAQATSDSEISVADLLKLVKGDAEKYIPTFFKRPSPQIGGEGKNETMRRKALFC